MQILWNVIGLADTALPWVSGAMAVLLVLGLVQWWRVGFAESDVGQTLGDSEDLRLNVTPLLFTTAVVCVAWPVGAFALMGWFADFSFSWRQNTREDVERAELPREGHFLLSLLRIAILGSIGAGLGAAVEIGLHVMAVQPTVPPVAAGGLIGGAWAVQRVSTGAPLLWGWTSLILWSALSGGELPESEEAPQDKPQVRRPVARAPQRPVRDEDPVAAARSLMAGVVARELAEIEADEASEEAKEEAEDEAVEEAEAAVGQASDEGEESDEVEESDEGEDVVEDSEDADSEAPADVDEAAPAPDDDAPEEAPDDGDPEEPVGGDVSEVEAAQASGDVPSSEPLPEEETPPEEGLDEDTDEATIVRE